MRAIGAAKITKLSIQRTEFVIDVVNEFRDNHIEVGVPVPMPVPVREDVERHGFNACLKIGAVVEIECADKHLIGFSVAAVLRENHTRYGFQQFAFV